MSAASTTRSSAVRCTSSGRSMAASLAKRLFTRHRTVLVFGAIGVFNTLVHAAIVVALVERLRLQPTAANVLAFAVANTGSYLANARFAFRQPLGWRRFGTFFTVSLGSLGCTVALSALAQAMGWHYLVGLALVLLCGPALSFALHQLLTFRPAAPQARGAR